MGVASEILLMYLSNVPTPYRYQLQTIDFIRERRHSIVAHEMGLGKTMCAILAADLPALVVCPASLILNWRREIELWRPEAAHLFSVLSYTNTTLGRIKAETMAHLYRTVVVDEAHYLKSPEAMRTKLTTKLIRHIGRRGKSIALSGTIVPNRPMELHPLLSAMGIYTKNKWRFGNRYAAGWKAPWGWDFSGSSRETELRALMAPHTIRYKKSQVLSQLPPKTWRVIALDLPTPRQEKRFSLSDLSKMEESLAFEALSDVLKLHGERKVPLATEHITNALADCGKVVVFCHHKSVIADLKERLASFNPVTVMGGQSTKAKQAAVDAFQDDPDVRVIIGQTTAMGTGWTLTAASRVIMVEGSWVPGELAQMADRCHRIGQRDNVTIDLLTIDGSIDEAMLCSALEKQAVIDAIVPETAYYSALE